MVPVQVGFLTLEQLLTYLSPSDEALTNSSATARTELQRAVDAIGKLDLSGDARGYEGNNAMAVALSAAAAPQQGSSAPRLTGATLDLDASRFDLATSALMPSNNQKLHLVQGFLAIGDWEHASKLMRWLQVGRARQQACTTLLASAIHALAIHFLFT